MKPSPPHVKNSLVLTNWSIETLKAVSSKRVQFQVVKIEASKSNNIPIGEPSKRNQTESATRLCAVLDSNGEEHDLDDIQGLPSFVE